MQAAPKNPAQQNLRVSRPSAQEYGVLKSRQAELSNQLNSVQDRREELVRDIQNRTGADRAGIEGRITILDQRLAQIESDLSSVGKDLAETAPAQTEVPPPVRWRGYDEGDMWTAGGTGALFMLALFVPFIIRNFVRRRRPVPSMSTPIPGIAGERIDRMESSIDSIAVEIERVSENQRFMTRLLTETQLAGTIAAVRGSAEAARLAADGGVDAKQL